MAFLLAACHSFSTLDDDDDDDDGDGNLAIAFVSFPDSTNFTISMELFMLWLNIGRLDISPSSLVRVIESDGGILHGNSD